MSQWGQGWALGQAGMAAGSAGGSTGLLTDPTPGAPARVQCPSSQQQTRAAPPSSDLGRGKCPALLQEGITPSTTMGVGRAGPGQEGQSVSHRLPQVMQEPRMVPQSQGQGQSPALPPTPATVLPQPPRDQHCSRDTGGCSTQLSCSLGKRRGEDKARI